METGIKVGDCMRTSLVTVPESTSVVEAAKKMAETGVGSLLVTNEKGIYGIVTERDFVLKSLALGKINSKVREICTKMLITIPVNEDISLAAKLMGEKNIKRIVVTSNGKIVGLVSQKDLISVAPSLYDYISDDKSTYAKLKVY
ncbi:MAG: CBS domain-containing protein [Candidatus Micrarchaeota archaeon]